MVTLQKLVPALGVLPRDQVYERILDNPELLDGCFQVFRSNPEAFSPLLVRSDKSPIITEADPLRCGRSLSQVIAMVVRSCARRYFRRALKEPAVRRPPPAKPTLLEWLGLVKQAPKKKPLTKADRLYRAISDHLLYEWQARLIPYYAPLPEQLVRGPRAAYSGDPGTGGTDRDCPVRPDSGDTGPGTGADPATATGHRHRISHARPGGCRSIPARPPPPGALPARWRRGCWKKNSGLPAKKAVWAAT